MKNKEFIDGVFQFFGEDNQNELNLMNKIFEGVDFNDVKSLMSITPKVLELPFNEQVHFIVAVLCYHYSLTEDSDRNENLRTFLGQTEFKDQRDIIKAVVDEEAEKKISEFEMKYNIKIVADASED